MGFVDFDDSLAHGALWSADVTLTCTPRRTGMRRLMVVMLLLAFPAAASAASPLAGLEAAKRPHLKSIYSTVHDLQEFAKKDTQAIVLIFLGTECPVALQYVPRLNE